MYEMAQDNLPLPGYDEIDQILTAIESIARPTEIHGLMTANLCGAVMNDAALVPPLLGQVELDELERAAFQQLYQVTDQRLQHLEFDFALLLPDDEAPLAERAEAMSAWCQGFLTGLKQYEIDETVLQSEDCQDALHRFMDLAILDYETVAVGEDDEKAFFEMSEYVRLAVLMIYSELLASLPPADSTDRVLH